MYEWIVLHLKFGTRSSSPTGTTPHLNVQNQKALCFLKPAFWEESQGHHRLHCRTWSPTTKGCKSKPDQSVSSFNILHLCFWLTYSSSLAVRKIHFTPPKTSSGISFLLSLPWSLKPQTGSIAVSIHSLTDHHLEKLNPRWPLNWKGTLIKQQRGTIIENQSLAFSNCRTVFHDRIPVYVDYFTFLFFIFLTPQPLNSTTVGSFPMNNYPCKMFQVFQFIS